MILIKLKRKAFQTHHFKDKHFKKKLENKKNIRHSGTKPGSPQSTTVTHVKDIIIFTIIPQNFRKISRVISHFFADKNRKKNKKKRVKTLETQELKDRETKKKKTITIRYFAGNERPYQ